MKLHLNLVAFVILRWLDMISQGHKETKVRLELIPIQTVRTQKKNSLAKLLHYHIYYDNVKLGNEVGNYKKKSNEIFFLHSQNFIAVGITQQITIIEMWLV